MKLQFDHREYFAEYMGTVVLLLFTNGIVAAGTFSHVSLILMTLLYNNAQGLIPHFLRNQAFFESRHGTACVLSNYDPFIFSKG